MSIYQFTQNICFFFSYVNQVFHTHKMWIMWITLCITLIYGLFHRSTMWIECVRLYPLFPYIDILCAICRIIYFRVFFCCNAHWLRSTSATQEQILPVGFSACGGSLQWHNKKHPASHCSAYKQWLAERSSFFIIFSI